MILGSIGTLGSIGPRENGPRSGVRARGIVPVVASGRTHNALNLGLLALGLGAVFWVAPERFADGWPRVFAFAGAYVVGTLLLSPDLDLAHGRVNAKRNWGALGALWVPYGRAFAHRGVSHTYLLGPLTRLLYLALLALPPALLLWALWPAAWATLLGHAQAATSLGPALLTGYVLSQWLHLMADGIWPWHEGRTLRRSLRARRGAR